MNITVRDDWVSRSLINAAIATWPDQNWPHWHVYGGQDGRKLATKDPSRVTEPCRMLIQELVRCENAPDGVFPDLDLHGAGMHWIPDGGWLGRHVDSNVHPVTGWRRRMNTILFLEGCIGGELVIGGERIVPEPNRVVTFHVSDDGWHEVLPVLGGNRRTLSLFWWDTGSVQNTRDHAIFSV